MFKSLVPAAVLAAGVFAAPVSAATTVSITPSTTACAGNTCSFSVDGSTTSRSFSTAGTFVLPKAGVLSAFLSNIPVSRATNIDFSSVTLTSPDGTVIPFSLSRLGIVDSASLTNLATMPGTYTLKLAGISGGNAAFGGNISFAGVPEPASWAFMIAGFTALGFAMRRRNSRLHGQRPTLRFV